MSKHPVLTKTGGKQMTYTDLTSHVKDMMRTILRLKRDADPIGYKPYSLRKGGAAHMHNVGASLMDIQALGQWKSSAFKTYMEAASVRTVASGHAVPSCESARPSTRPQRCRTYKDRTARALAG